MEDPMEIPGRGQVAMFQVEEGIRVAYVYRKGAWIRLGKLETNVPQGDVSDDDLGIWLRKQIPLPDAEVEKLDAPGSFEIK